MSPKWMNISNPLPFGLLRRIAGVNPLIVNYHVVSDKRLPHIINLYKYRNIKAFREDLDFFSGHYHPISLFEFLDHLKNRSQLPENSILLTFDDGFKEIYEVAAPILLEKGIPATFFLTKDYIDNGTLGYDGKKSLIIDKIRSEDSDPGKLKGMMDFKNREELVSSVFNISYSNRIQIDNIADRLNIDFAGYLKNVTPYVTTNQITHLIQEGFAIGSHSLDHANFKELTPDDQIHQVMTSVNYLCEKFSLQYRVFAFPYTDIGISRDFFVQIEKSIDATFGTQGLMTDTIGSNFQRIGVEKFAFPANHTIKFYYLRRLLHSLFNKETIQRN